MKKCKFCEKELDNEIICPQCGMYQKISLAGKLYIIGIVCLIVSIIGSKRSLIIFILPSIICLFIGLILFITDCIKIFKIRKNNPEILKQIKPIDGIDKKILEKTNIKLSPYFIKADFRKQDEKIERGECDLEFQEEKFYIKQGEKIIENNLSSVYFLDIWKYGDETYFKIVMRSHNEYMFKSVNFEADKILDFLSKIGIKVKDNR